MDVQGFLEKIRAKFATGDATEHSYRSALEGLFESIGPDISAINEPKRVACGAPDFVIRVGEIDIGHCEAKDINVDLTALKEANLAQKKRYLKGLPNLIYTNGLDFEFYKSGALVRRISIGALANGKLLADAAEFPALATQLADFAAERPQTIITAKKLAEMMAGKAALIKDIMGRALVADVKADRMTDLRSQYEVFKAHLIHDITVAEFADVYAETIAYGLFAARLHDPSPESFSRTEALDLLPKSNPFLRSLFGYIAGVDLDDRVRWVIDELCDVFRAADLHEILKDFGKFTGRDDPFIHFYETFLAEYNPAKRKSRGVWYTPEPVVNFIVRAVDEVLKAEFGLTDGLADTSKITIDWETGQTDKRGRRETIKKQVHRVQILDPATGTGTFLAEVTKQIAARVKHRAEGMWSSYVEQDLIPRLHGFELLMASYAMCHMKLDMVLTELGYNPTSNPPRLSVYLTNSLEEGEEVDQSLPFANWLATEAKGANTIKRDVPIMCVIGNPPYSGLSQNMGPWITGLIEDYKYVDGVHFGERKHWLHDDYVKFIRLAEYMIDKNGEGILGFITNHGYIDNPTFRGMRRHLMRSFDSIYVLNLHGNSKRKEICPDGSPDANIFDIQQGVAIIVAVRRKGSAKREASVRFGELWGARDLKYDQLFGKRLKDLVPEQLAPKPRYYMFYPIDHALLESYDRGFALNELFCVGSSAFVTGRDEVNISFTREEAIEKLNFMATASEADIRKRFGPNFKDSRDWTVATAKTDALQRGLAAGVEPCTYRAFDTRFTCYTGHSRGLYSSPQPASFNGHQEPAYVALASARINSGAGGPGYFIAVNQICDFHLCSDSTSNFPLYIHPSAGDLQTGRRVNFDPKIYAAIREKAALSGAEGDELLVFDYIYGVLHAPEYRQTYAQFLRIDFPRIPYPRDPETFLDVAAKGRALRRLHLMEPDAIGDAPYSFKGEGAGEVARVEYSDDCKVFINKHQYFEAVPRSAWEFRIAGYEPAQKWLKDRKGRNLSFDEVRHYQRLLKVLAETIRIMNEIELPIDEVAQ